MPDPHGQKSSSKEIKRTFHAMSPIIADEDLLLVVGHDAVRKLQILRTAELLQYVPVHVEYQDTHDFAFHHHDSALAVHRHAARMLQNGRSEFAQKLSVLIVDLDLMSRTAFCHDDVARRTMHRHAIRIQQLTVAFSAFAEMKLVTSFLVEDLNTMIVRIGHDDVVLRIDRHAGRFRELTLHNSEFTKLAVIDHFMAFNLRFRRKERRSAQFHLKVDLLRSLSVTGAAENARVVVADSRSRTEI